MQLAAMLKPCPDTSQSPETNIHLKLKNNKRSRIYGSGKGH